MNDPDREFHNCNKPHFSENGVFVYGNKGSANLEGGVYPTAQEPLVGAANDIRFTKMPTFEEVSVPFEISNGC
jgi:nuclear pore complex protein Nup98-Nup96